MSEDQFHALLASRLRQSTLVGHRSHLSPFASITTWSNSLDVLFRKKKKGGLKEENKELSMRTWAFAFHTSRPQSHLLEWSVCVFVSTLVRTKARKKKTACDLTHS
jgi:hypothetical protein